MSRVRAILATCLLATSMTTVAAAITESASAGAVARSTAPAPGPTCGYVRPRKPGGGRYACTFTDDFSGTALDKAKWVVQKTSTSGFTTGGGGDCYLDNPNNVSVAGGAARLTARVESSPFTCVSPYGSFTTNRTAGSALTYGKFAQTYGRFEFRAKFPATTVTGVHSALWMFPQNPAYGGWPNSGEIDVAEWFSAAPQNVYPSVHYAGEVWPNSTGMNCLVSTATSEFHNYAVEWTASIMKFYYDGQMCFSHSWLPNPPLVAPQPFDKPFDLIMGQAFGNSWNSISAETATVATMYVDWVRAWK